MIQNPGLEEALAALGAYRGVVVVSGAPWERLGSVLWRLGRVLGRLGAENRGFRRPGSHALSRLPALLGRWEVTISNEEGSLLKEDNRKTSELYRQPYAGA